MLAALAAEFERVLREINARHLPLPRVATEPREHASRPAARVQHFAFNPRWAHGLEQRRRYLAHPGEPPHALFESVQIREVLILHASLRYRARPLESKSPSP